MRIAGVVVLYHPDNDLISRLKTYLSALDLLYVVDNTEIRSKAISNEFLNNSGIIYLHDGENKGIAARLNEVATHAITTGCNYLLTMDQDSYFEEGSINNYLTCVSSYADFAKTAMFGVEFLDQPKEFKCKPEHVTELITSGSILNLNLFNSIGCFDEKLFIDYVDHEYCYRAILKGFYIVKFKNVFLQHKVGEQVKIRTFGFLKYSERSFHSSARLYYMLRNYLYINSIYSQSFQYELKNQKRSVLVRIKNKILYDKERWVLSKYLYKAYKDFRSGNMGKLES